MKQKINKSPLSYCLARGLYFLIAAIFAAYCLVSSVKTSLDRRKADLKMKQTEDASAEILNNKQVSDASLGQSQTRSGIRHLFIVPVRTMP